VAVVLGYLAGVVGLLPKPEVLDVWSLAGTLVILGGAPSPYELPETPAS